MIKCVQCNRESEYDSPNSYCRYHWVAWWYESWEKDFNLNKPNESMIEEYRVVKRLLQLIKTDLPEQQDELEEAFAEYEVWKNMEDSQEVTPMKIDSFSDDFRFLSNFWESPVRYDGIVYPTNEHFYQAMKTKSRSTRKKMATISSPGRVKREGQKVDLRKDWESIKIDVMREGLALKFAEGTILAKMLEATHPATLVEGNYWGDKFWGVDNKTGQGKNWLGKLLMERRAQLLKLSEEKEGK